MENHQRYCVHRADRLGEGAGVDPGIILERSGLQVGHNGDKGQHPYQEHMAEGVPVTVQFVILETVANVAVAVNGDSGDIEYRADDTQTHQKCTNLTVHVTQIPSIVNYGCQHQGIWVNRHHEVCHR